jgi:hypothetical protein
LDKVKGYLSFFILFFLVLFAVNGCTQEPPEWGEPSVEEKYQKLLNNENY